MEYVYQDRLAYAKGVGVVFGSFVPLHQGHLDAIYQAKKECPGGVLVVVCGYDGDKGYPLMPLSTRYQLTRQFFLNDPLVAVYAISDDELGIAGRTDAWDIWLKAFMEQVVWANSGGTILVDPRHFTFYVGEPEYARDIEASGYKAKLLDRSQNEIRATYIRTFPFQNWDQIAQTYQRLFSHNILITGTASEGKTTLTQDIARYFNLPYSKEWARGYVNERTLGDWQFDSADFLTFLTGQFNHNRECLESRLNRGVFISDTDVTVTKMYAKYYASKGNMGITMDEYTKVIEPAADVLAKSERWNKIFVLIPKGEFVDDHTRYMGHSSMESRNAMIDILLQEMERFGYKERIEILDGGYLENYERVKAYVKKQLQWKEGYHG